MPKAGIDSRFRHLATFLTKVWQDSKILQQKYTLQIFPFHDDQFHEKWLSSVLGKEFDCITSPYDVKSWYKNFRVLRLGEEKFKLAVPFSHPLSKLSGIKLSDLFGCTLLTPPRSSPAVDELCRALEKKISANPGYAPSGLLYSQHLLEASRGHPSDSGHFPNNFLRLPLVGT